MTEQEKGDLSIQVTTWEGMTVNELQIVFYIQLFKCVGSLCLIHKYVECVLCCTIQSFSAKTLCFHDKRPFMFFKRA
jgi:hypothetical protein